jgi:pyrroloquinoline quinone biosynthesis protein D
MRCRPPMDFPETDVLPEMKIGLDDVPEISRHFRLQFEQAQSAWVLLYPEGMVKLSASAGEIMKRIDGGIGVERLIHDLETTFPGADLRQDVLEFLNAAHQRGWVRGRR